MDAATKCRAVIIDLDGTLVDSAGEIAVALDRTFDELRLPHVAHGETEKMIGRGVPMLLERALARVNAKSVDRADAIAKFKAQYERTVGTTATLFPGAMEGLRIFEARGIRRAVVTNKPRFFTQRLLERLDVARFFDCVVAGDDGIRQKPAGDMLLAACKAMDVEPARALMLGDSDNDIAAARAAHCPVWCVPYGYNEGRPAVWLACDRLVGSIEEAARLLS